MKIIIETIEHFEQRYSTVGDWQFIKGDDDSETIHIKVSDLGKWQYSMLVGMHEAIEALLCLGHGVSQADVDSFDIKFEANRDVDDNSEPGDHPNAPYMEEHFFATSIERLLAA